MAYYRKPGWFTSMVFNPAVAAMTRAGISIWGSRVLRVRGRKSGELRSAPVNLLTYEEKQYLVAPRGLTQWVRNLREAGQGELLLGNRVQHFRAHEISDDQKVPILRAYSSDGRLRWAFSLAASARTRPKKSSDALPPTIRYSGSTRSASRRCRCIPARVA